MTDKTLTADRLRELLEYDQQTGVFTRRIQRGGRHLPGAVAGTNHSRGYRAIHLDGKTYKAHRLAWLHVYGCWPLGEIDHINRDKVDNRICNLRVATRSENTMNRDKARADNKLGVLGVSQVGNRYIARIAIGGKSRYLGIHKTTEQAKAAYDAVRKELP